MKKTFPDDIIDSPSVSSSSSVSSSVSSNVNPSPNASPIFSRKSMDEAKGKELKISTNKQMLNRLAILLAQIQAGNNSKSLKNELRQLMYSLYSSKALTKTVYNNLIKVIRAEH